MGNIVDDTWILKFNMPASSNEFEPEMIRASDYNEDEAGSFYEVIRIIGGAPLFLSSHYERLANSLKLSGSDMLGLSFKMLKAGIAELVRANGLKECNVKVTAFPERKSLYMYISPHHYPSEDERKNGVSVTLIHVKRKNPNIKQLDAGFKMKVAEAIRERNVFEALLVDDAGFVTEGGRTNVFFIIGQEVRTAPEDLVLKGITREYVLKACADAGVKVIEKAVKSVDVKTASAAFITGTSIKVLPISKIDEISFDPGEKTLKSISIAFDRISEEDESGG